MSTLIDGINKLKKGQLPQPILVIDESIVGEKLYIPVNLFETGWDEDKCIPVIPVDGDYVPAKQVKYMVSGSDKLAVKDTFTREDKFGNTTDDRLYKIADNGEDLKYLLTNISSRNKTRPIFFDRGTMDSDNMHNIPVDRAFCVLPMDDNAKYALTLLASKLHMNNMIIGGSVVIGWSSDYFFGNMPCYIYVKRRDDPTAGDEGKMEVFLVTVSASDLNMSEIYEPMTDGDIAGDSVFVGGIGGNIPFDDVVNMLRDNKADDNTRDILVNAVNRQMNISFDFDDGYVECMLKKPRGEMTSYRVVDADGNGYKKLQVILGNGRDMASFVDIYYDAKEIYNNNKDLDEFRKILMENLVERLIESNDFGKTNANTGMVYVPSNENIWNGESISGVTRASMRCAEYDDDGNLVVKEPIKSSIWSVSKRGIVSGTPMQVKKFNVISKSEVNRLLKSRDFISYGVYRVVPRTSKDYDGLSDIISQYLGDDNVFSMEISLGSHTTKRMAYMFGDVGGGLLRCWILYGNECGLPSYASIDSFDTYDNMIIERPSGYDDYVDRFRKLVYDNRMQWQLDDFYRNKQYYEAEEDFNVTVVSGSGARGARVVDDKFTTPTGKVAKNPKVTVEMETGKDTPDFMQKLTVEFEFKDEIIRKIKEGGELEKGHVPVVIKLLSAKQNLRGE